MQLNDISSQLDWGNKEMKVSLDCRAAAGGYQAGNSTLESRIFVIINSKERTLDRIKL